VSPFLNLLERRSKSLISVYVAVEPIAGARVRSV
jgi:hypothetical protein